ncbi:MAG: carboxypeptidase-like regulatory domain-containing protein [Aigarchaeota archaeon]|nr:carboxypeptidase-like regulatory domain-containing protein [Aigarchaeota archaeon]MDW8093119.1 carboxypeptidase-like regulatory domain-containing protein [Nitrososphaerota archaeon]
MQTTWRSTALVALLVLAFSLVQLMIEADPVNASVSDLTVLVYDAKGNPRQGVEVSLTNATVTFRSTTDVNGRAVFRSISSGGYEAYVTVGGVKVASARVTLPTDSTVRLNLMVSTIKVEVRDVENVPVQGLTVTISPSGRLFSRSAVTNINGSATFPDLPNSALDNVGEYTIEALYKGIRVAEVRVTLPVADETVTVNAKVAPLSLRFVDLERVPVPSASLNLRAGPLQEIIQVTNGEMGTVQLPLSEVVGTYSYSVLMSYTDPTRPFPVFNGTLSLTSRVTGERVLELARLSLTLRDDAGQPLQGMTLELSNERTGLIGRATSGTAGTALFEFVPLSRGQASPGDYRLTVSKQGTPLTTYTVTLAEPSRKMDLVVERRPFIVRVIKADGSPLIGAVLNLIDVVTGQRSNGTTDSEGRVTTRALGGAHSYEVIYKGNRVSSGMVDLMGDVATITALGVDLRVILKVYDWFGNPIPDAVLNVYQRGERIPTTTTGPNVHSAVLPVAGSFTVEVLLGDELSMRRHFETYTGTTLVVSLYGLYLNGTLIDAALLFNTVSAVFLAAAVIAVGVIYLSRKRKMAPEKDSKSEI